MKTRDIFRVVCLSAILVLGLRAQAKVVAERIFPGADQGPLREMLVATIASADPHAYRRAMISLGTFDSRKWLKEIKGPTLVITGMDDTTVAPVGMASSHMTSRTLAVSPRTLAQSTLLTLVPHDVRPVMAGAGVSQRQTNRLAARKNRQAPPTARTRRHLCRASSVNDDRCSNPAPARIAAKNEQKNNIRAGLRNSETPGTQRCRSGNNGVWSPNAKNILYRYEVWGSGACYDVYRATASGTDQMNLTSDSIDQALPLGWRAAQ